LRITSTFEIIKKKIAVILFAIVVAFPCTKKVSMRSRRSFLKQSIAVSLGFTGLAQYVSNIADAKPLEFDRGDKQWLELPTGFNTKIISSWGDKMSDGLFVPSRPDGMAAFDLNGKVVIIRNHENSPTMFEGGAFGKDLALLPKIKSDHFFDYGYGKTPGLGGTTTLIFDEGTQTVEQQFLSLAGTYRNCAGGPTPWNSWITCEEDTAKRNERAEVDHGYNFEVPATATGIVTPIPLKAMGRFNHEAVCVDPATGIVYQTEDRGDGLIYRFIPHTHNDLQGGGILQALCIKGSASFDTRNWDKPSMTLEQVFDVEWITLTDVESPADDLRLRGFAQGAAVFARGEGMWFGNREIYFACTNGGARKSGQVFKYIPSQAEGTPLESDQPGKLILFAEPNNTDILKYCDNLTVSPWGDVILVEDSPNAYIRGITPEGKIYNIGRNSGSRSELAGICFSPSGKTMFVNIQEQGLTFAVTGPWEKLRNNL
jgi:uncharacterized protein